jgi:hypothetical protein
MKDTLIRLGFAATYVGTILLIFCWVFGIGSLSELYNTVFVAKHGELDQLILFLGIAAPVVIVLDSLLGKVYGKWMGDPIRSKSGKR